MSEKSYPSYRTPGEDDIVALGDALELKLTSEEIDDYTALVDAAVDGIGGIRETEPIGEALEPHPDSFRGTARRPGDDEDPLNAWLLKATVEPTGEGPLTGTTVGLKDSIALAGYEMTAGSTVLEGFVPRIDAPVVARLLEHGATVAGKVNMESFAWSGRGDLSDYGPVSNPQDPAYLAGGSSSGSAAATAVGDCDIALGTDQAGSIRIPSAWCGLVGIKPTHGLVPYTGILPLEHTLDHVGPMGPAVEPVANALSVMAGEYTLDGVRLDDRQPHGIEGRAYADAMDDPVDGLSIGILEEGFDWPASDPVVDETVREAIDRFEPYVDRAESVNLPMHRRAPTVWAPIATCGGVQTLFQSGVGVNTRSWAWPGLATVLDALREARMHELPPSVKRTMLASAYIDDTYGIEPYAKARDAAIRARQVYDRLLEEYDALALPTTVVRAFEAGRDEGRVAMLEREVETVLNTCMFNVTGHPAITIPCDVDTDRQIGLMLVGSHFDESTLFALAGAFERMP